MKLEQQLKQLSFSGLAAALLLMIVPEQAFAMHIMEGFLPPMWALARWLLFYPACGTDWYVCAKSCRRITTRRFCWPCVALLFCAVGAENSFRYWKLLTSYRCRPGGYPVWTGRGSHPWCDCPAVPCTLLAHGGLTTLGANGMSMAVIGPVVGYMVWKMACRAGLRRDVCVFLCAMLADLVTYFVTSVQLGVAFPDPSAGATGSIIKFMGIFCLTQIPIAIAEGLLTVLIYDQLTKRQLITAQGH